MIYGLNNTRVFFFQAHLNHKLPLTVQHRYGSLDIKSFLRHSEYPGLMPMMRRVSTFILCVKRLNIGGSCLMISPLTHPRCKGGRTMPVAIGNDLAIISMSVIGNRSCPLSARLTWTWGQTNASEFHVHNKNSSILCDGEPSIFNSTQSPENNK